MNNDFESGGVEEKQDAQKVFNEKADEKEITDQLTEEEKAKLTKIEKRAEWIRALKFLLFSISAGVIQLLSFTLLNEVVKASYWVSYLIALVLSVLYNFTINRKFTFKSANNVSVAMIKVAVYYAIFTPLSTWWGDALTKINWNEYIILIGTMVINFVTEFLFTRFVVYKNSINTSKEGRKEKQKAIEQAKNQNDK